jgi:hypothetical protein
MSETNTQKPKTITAEEFDRKVDAGEDILEYLDLSKTFRPGEEPLPVRLTLPFNVLLKVEQEAVKRGMTREALMEAWIAEKAG